MFNKLEVRELVSTSRQPVIAARTSPERKAQFAALASRHGMSESALLTRLIDAVLNQNSVAVSEGGDDAPDDADTKRITLRLRPGDHPLVEARASARHMKPATYLVMLVHAHVRSRAPMPAEELNALKLSVSQLSMVGRCLQQVVCANGAQADVEHLALLLHQTAEALGALRGSVAELVQTNLRSWEAGDVPR
jgi:hypothetical protein